MVRFATCGETLDPALREEILALGPAAIPELLRVLNDDALHRADSPGEGWPPIHAVDLLADLKATEAIEPMLRLLCEGDWDEILYDRVVLRMAALGPALVEPALAAMARGVSDDAHAALCSVLAQVGVRDARIYDHLCALFDRDQDLGVICLEEYGDPAALPILEGALEDFDPDLPGPYGLAMLREYVASFELLGGVMSPELAEHVAALRHHFAAPPAGQTAPEKIGRNDPCPCGSGKKYKRCCLDSGSAPAR